MVSIPDCVLMVFEVSHPHDQQQPRTICAAHIIDKRIFFGFF
jgi:hypothetical protein